MATRGRPRKSTEQHKLDGTYQACRHKNNSDIVLAHILEVPKKIEVPQEIKNLKNKKVEAAFKKHVEMLIRLKICYEADLPALVNIYILLNDIYSVRETLQKIDMENQPAFYFKLHSLFLSQVEIFNKLASKFCLTPQARTQITIGELQALNENIKLQEKMQNIKTNPIEHLIQQKKS